MRYSSSEIEDKSTCWKTHTFMIALEIVNCREHEFYSFVNMYSLRCTNNKVLQILPVDRGAVDRLLYIININKEPHYYRDAA